jgi:molecular chaperone GrpE
MTQPSEKKADETGVVTVEESGTPDESTARRTAQESPGPSAAEAADLKDRLMRVLADQENFRRRVERDCQDAVRFAATQLVKDLLQTADNLSRALESVPSVLSAQSEALHSLLAGVAATERALQESFAKHGIRRLQPTLGEPFDPNQHQAMFEVEGGECPPGTIAQVVLPGYAYHERLLRPAFVGVAKSSNAEGQDRRD